jgi:hypothetical protein
MSASAFRVVHSEFIDDATLYVIERTATIPSPAVYLIERAQVGPDGNSIVTIHATKTFSSLEHAREFGRAWCRTVQKQVSQQRRVSQRTQPQAACA